MNINYLWAKLLKRIRGSAIINSCIDKTAKVNSGSHVVNSTIGRHSYCGSDCTIINAEIGSFCSIAKFVTIGGAMHPMEYVSTSPAFFKGRRAGTKHKFYEHPINRGITTKIGNDVWIGNNVLIKQGVSVGNGAVIGMGSVVTKDIPDFAIVGGVPANVIKYRFSNSVISSLLYIEWWNMSDEELNKYAKYFNDPLTLIKEIEK